MQNYVKTLFSDSELVELRVMNAQYVTAGIYDNPDHLMNAVSYLKKTDQYLGIYTTLNRPDPQYFTFKNQLNPKTRSVKDQDITHIRRIPFDFDPVRDKDTNANAHQVSLALQSSSLLSQWLTQRGWPKPLTAMSGNGAHLQYRCALESTPALAQAMTKIYQSLAKMFESDLVHFDQKVCNPSRIFRLYDTINRKSPHTETTPQRQAICHLPQPFLPVTEAQLLDLADYLDLTEPTVLHLPHAPQLRQKGDWTNQKGDYRTLDIVSMLTDMGLYKRSMGQGKHAVYCPWGTDHSTTQKKATTDTIIWEKSGDAWPQFHCSHNSCQSRNIVSLIQQVGTIEVVSYCQS